ncbi:MAG: DUF6438 domain-containing protein [Salibacteraceae bacterium]
MKKLFIFLLPLLFLGCKNNKNQVQESKVSESRLAFSFERTPCFGTCAEYVLTVYENGEAKFEGKKNTDLIGSYTCDDCDEEMMHRVMKTAGRINFWQLEDKYDPGVADLPSTITTIYLKEPPKSVVNVMGAPVELTELEKQIDDYYLKRNWSKID